MVNSPRAGNRAAPAPPPGVCAISGDENRPPAPAKPIAAAPPMKPRLQMSHISPPRIGVPPTLNCGPGFVTEWVRLLARIVTQIAGRVARPPRRQTGIGALRQRYAASSCRLAQPSARALAAAGLS